MSLLEYIYIQSKSINSEYIEQVRFLQRNLELPITPNKKELRKEIHNKINKKYPIDENDLLEALAITKIMPLSKKDLRIFLASANLINSWLANQRINDKSNKLFRNMYYFKSYLAKATSAMISNNNYFESNLYIDNNLIMFEIEEYQYSFHSVPKTDTMKAYEQSLDNIEIIWSKKRLQPIASPIFQLEKSFNTDDFLNKMSKQNVKLISMGDNKLRLVTHKNYTNQMHKKFLDIICNLKL